MKIPMMYEKMATPNSKIKAVSSLSELLHGWKSPKPIVEREVNAKYIITRALSYEVMHWSPY